MGISRVRPGPFAGPIFIAAAIGMAWTGAARATTCAQAIAAFDAAVKTGTREGATRSFDDLSFTPGCKAPDKIAARNRLVNFLIDYAGALRVTDAERDGALHSAERILDVSGSWRGKEKLADYYYTHHDLQKAREWYEKSVSALGTADPPATDEEKEVLTIRLYAAQSFANDDEEGRRSISFTPTMRDAAGQPGGLYSDELRPRGAIPIKVPIPIQFEYDKAVFTPLGEQTMRELVDAARQLQKVAAAAGTVPTMKLVGHADPRGGDQHNMVLSKNRVIAVRDELMRQGVKAQFDVKWVGAREEFKWQLLPNANQLTQEEKWQLDRRVEWVRDGSE